MGSADRARGRRSEAEACAGLGRGVRLILLTAQRPGEVFTIRWRDIEDSSRLSCRPADERLVCVVTVAGKKTVREGPVVVVDSEPESSASKVGQYETMGQ